MGIPSVEEIERVYKLQAQERKLKRDRIICAVIAGVSVLATIYCGKKLKDVLGVVNSAITDVSSLTYVDIQQSIVDKAVEKAAMNAANRATKAAEGVIRDRIENQVVNAVLNSKGAIKTAVTEKIAIEIANIDQSELVEDITEQAKELIVNKFEGKLDGIAADFSRNLENVGKIYQSIAETMQKTA